MEADQQWALVVQVRDALKRNDTKQVGLGLEESWQCLDISSDPYLLRESCNLSDLVLPSIVTWIEEIDDYPPPEMLIALVTMFNRYKDAAGRLTLEEALLGKPVQRIGSYAARKAKFDAELEIGFRLAFLGGKHRGLSDIKAAERAQAEMENMRGSCPDAETMLKRMRRRGVGTNKP